jgi:hypothetical protein
MRVASVYPLCDWCKIVCICGLYIVEVSTKFKINFYQALYNSVPFQELHERAHEFYSTTRASTRAKKNTNTEKKKSGEYIVCITTQSMILHNDNSTVF